MYKINRMQIYAILVAALILHMTVLNNLRIFDARPDIALICIVFFGLFMGEGAGLEAGLVAGLLQDIFAMDFFWINTFILGSSGLLAGALGAKFSKESPSGQITLVFSFTVFSMALHFMLGRFFSKFLVLGLGEYFISSVLPTSLYTGLVSVPIFSKFIDIYNLRELEDLL